MVFSTRSSAFFLTSTCRPETNVVKRNTEPCASTSL
jgi:hypothetical protein